MKTGEIKRGHTVERMTQPRRDAGDCLEIIREQSSLGAPRNPRKLRQSAASSGDRAVWQADAGRRPSLCIQWSRDGRVQCSGFTMMPFSKRPGLLGKAGAG